MGRFSENALYYQFSWTSMYPDTRVVVQPPVTALLLMFAPDGAAGLLTSCHTGLHSDASKWQYGISPHLSRNLPHKWLEMWCTGQEIVRQYIRDSALHCVTVHCWAVNGWTVNCGTVNFGRVHCGTLHFGTVVRSSV